MNKEIMRSPRAHGPASQLPLDNSDAPDMRREGPRNPIKFVQRGERAAHGRAGGQDFELPDGVTVVIQPHGAQPRNYFDERQKLDALKDRVLVDWDTLYVSRIRNYLRGILNGNRDAFGKLMRILNENGHTLTEAFQHTGFLTMSPEDIAAHLENRDSVQEVGQDALDFLDRRVVNKTKDLLQTVHTDMAGGTPVRTLTAAANGGYLYWVKQTYGK